MGRSSFRMMPFPPQASEPALQAFGEALARCVAPAQDVARARHTVRERRQPGVGRAKVVLSWVMPTSCRCAADAPLPNHDASVLTLATAA